MSNTILKIYLDHLRRSGVTDFNAYLTNNSLEAAKCLRMIKTVEFNDAFLKLLEVDTREELMANFPFMGNSDNCIN